jgi:hypothetical protein
MAQELGYEDRAKAVRGSHQTVIVLSNSGSSALASLLYNIELIEKLGIGKENEKILAPNQVEDLLKIRQEVYGY